MKKIFFGFAFSILLIPGASAQILTPLVDSIPMRDGKKLAADIHIPAGCTQCPVILIQTPYNRLLYRFGLPLGVKLNLNSSNYIFVIADWRGFYGSNAAAYSGSPTRGQDGYDAVQWVAQKSWSNGKVATWGPSALGRVQFMTAKENPPNLVCIVPQVAGPQYDYQEYFPNGVYRTEYVEQLDALGYGMSPILMANPVYNTLWTIAEAQNFYPDSIRIPTLMIGGWYDHTIVPMLEFFNAIRAQSPVNVQSKHRLLMGPWVHGGHGSSYVGSAQQGQLSYPNAAGWSDSLAMLFLDHHVRNVANGWNTSSFVTYYQMGDNMWQSAATWPPAGLGNYKLYFHSDTSLDLIAPSSASASSLSFSYNPLDPSPTIGGPTLRNDLDQGPFDQDSAVESRNDILKFTSAVLTQDVVMKGSAKVHLSVSSDKKDTDFAVRLTDVYPDGRSMLVNDGIFRMRFRNGFKAADTAVMVPNTIYTCDIDLPATALTFKAGHRIRVDITSSNYPRFNRNANNGGVMYPGNNGDSLQNPVTAVNKIYTDDLTNHSYISMPLTASPPLAVSEMHTELIQAEIFPNPTTGKFTVQTSGYNVEEIEVTDMTGRLLKTIKAQQGVYSMDTPKGIYLLNIISGGKTITVKKIVVF